jgi:serine/threonine protein kinase
MTHAGELLCGRYRIERLLGQGGMADVFRAIDTTNGEAVAVKLVR